MFEPCIPENLDDLVEVEHNLSTVREQLLEINPNITEEEITKVWSQCNGNPDNAGLIYKLDSL